MTVMTAAIALERSAGSRAAPAGPGRRSWLDAAAVEWPCTVEIAITADDVYAHVTLDGGVEAEPGDAVEVLGPPFRVGFGEILTERRRARLTRAGRLRRAWTRLAARFQLTELYEVSFTPGRTP